MGPNMSRDLYIWVLVRGEIVEEDGGTRNAGRNGALCPAHCACFHGVSTQFRHILVSVNQTIQHLYLKIYNYII